jgi:hypothetical protein
VPAPVASLGDAEAEASGVGEREGLGSTDAMGEGEETVVAVYLPRSQTK